MAHIHYIRYSFNCPATPLSESDYRLLKGMKKADFEEYLSDTSSEAWKVFREHNNIQIKIVLWGGIGGFFLTYVFQRVDLFVVAGFFAIFTAFLAGCSLLMSANFYSACLRSQEKILKKRYKIISLSRSYEEYVSHEAKTK